MTTHKHIHFALTSAITLSFLILAGSARGDTIDLSSDFDDAGDYGPVIVEWMNNAVVPTASITDVAGPQVRYRNTRTSSGKAILSMLSSATFNPSTQGSMNNIDWSATVEDSGPTPAALFPMLSQGGVFYMYKGGAIVNSDLTGDNAFYENSSTPSAQSLTDALEAEFEELDLVTPSITGSPYGPETIAASTPDFSAAGGLITFGYLSVSDSGGARDNFADHEDITVIVDFTAPPTAPAPEPSALLLALCGIVCGGRLFRRSRCRTRS